MVFIYPNAKYTAKHGPYGYERYSSYKAWLRDEFWYRCVYCLSRETWYPTGSSCFAVEHIAPKGISEYRDLETVYENLAYACNLCNSRKGTNLTLNPRVTPFGKHLRVDRNGRIEPLTSNGELMILLLGLDEQNLTLTRKYYIDTYESYHAAKIQNPHHNCPHYNRAFSFPSNIPDLTRKRPPGNCRKMGCCKCHFQKLRGKQRPVAYFPDR